VYRFYIESIYTLVRPVTTNSEAVKEENIWKAVFGTMPLGVNKHKGEEQ